MTTNVPEVGKIYHVFDDGKITWSRHFLVKCKAVIPLKQFATDPQYAKVYEAWKDRGCDWLYADTTDYVVACEDIEDSVIEDMDKWRFPTRIEREL